MGGNTDYDYESVRKARIQQIQERFDSLGVKNALLGLRSVKPKGKWVKVDYGSWPRRSSPRLNPTSPCTNGNENMNAKRKRGRPRKYPFLDGNENMTNVKRKRGRPRKYRLLVGSAERLEDNKTKALQLITIRVKEQGDDLEMNELCPGNENMNAMIMTTNVKRKRGRPRKYPLLNGSVEHLEDSKTKSLQLITIGMKEQGDDLEMNEPCPEATSGCITPSDYESIRNARIQENQARLAILGVQKALFDLRSITPSGKPVRKTKKVDYVPSPLRRSSRLKATTEHNGTLELYVNNEEEWEKKSPANGSWVLSPEVVERRCSSKNRGTVYHPAGISCHFCRQKTLCSEEECKRCGDFNMDQPCIGKTECSLCHSSNGVLCRACLKIRYGEEMEEVRGNKEWMCPHCVEDKGIKRYWICNSSICLKRRKLAPTGIAIFKAREMGFKSVAHFLMDQLQRNQSKMTR